MQAREHVLKAAWFADSPSSSVHVRVGLLEAAEEWAAVVHSSLAGLVNSAGGRIPPAPTVQGSGDVRAWV